MNLQQLLLRSFGLPEHRLLSRPFSSTRGLNRMSSFRDSCLCILTFMVLLSVPGWSQNEIVKNDSAKLLRKVWMMRGSVAGGDRIGATAGWIGDLNNDSIQDFIWGFGRLGQWRVQYGGPVISDTAAQIFELKTTLTYPVVGDFWGNGEESVAFGSVYFSTDSQLRMHVWIPVYGVEGDTLKLEPRAEFDPARGLWPEMSGTADAMYAADLDGDGDDELIVVANVIRRNDGIRDARAEVWIFAGGPEFGLDSPTVVLKDDEENDDTYYASVGDLDGDHYPEIIVGGIYKQSPRNRLKFWRGSSSLISFSLSPDRSVDIDQSGLTRPPTSPVFLDVDGDSTLDIVGNILTDIGLDHWQINLYTSRSGSSVWDRPFTEEDAQQQYRTTSLYAGGSLGYINDSTRHYEMLGLFGPSGAGGAGIFGLSGGRNGPNATYDGYYSAADDGLVAGDVFSVGGPVGDATGDGYDDYLTGNPEWYGLEQGIVLLLAGGPYIPNDDPTVSVREEPIAGESGGLYLWPNPVGEELHIAWKGNLKKMPSRFAVYDLAGRLVVEGEVEGWRGEAIWRCSGVASGVYVLTAFDSEENQIGTTEIIKQ